MSERYFMGESSILQSQQRIDSRMDDIYCARQKTSCVSSLVDEIDQEIAQISELGTSSNLCGEDLIIQMILSEKLTVNDVKNFSRKIDEGEYYWLEGPVTKSEKN